MKILALIPARGGSQRVPMKNIKSLNGKPLIAYTIEAAKRSRPIHRVVVSTDAEEIALVAKDYGAETPFRRPAEIAKPDSTEMEFFKHALDWLQTNEGYEPDLIVLLYPTSPFRKAESIDRAIEEILRHPEADSLRSVRKCTEHPYKMWTLDQGLLTPFVKEDTDKNVHTLSYHLLPEVYIQNASIYITRPKTIREKGSPMGDVILSFVMDDVESIDVNTSIDFAFAERVMKKGER